MRTLNPNTLERVENYITEYQKKNGKSPSYRQIMHGANRQYLRAAEAEAERSCDCAACGFYRLRTTC